RRVIGPGGARTICGVQFIIPVESQMDVVRFVYGDGRRWLAVWDARQKSAPVLGLFWNLTRLGVKGTVVCVEILAGMGWRSLGRGTEKLLRFLSLGKRARVRAGVTVEEMA